MAHAIDFFSNVPLREFAKPLCTSYSCYMLFTKFQAKVTEFGIAKENMFEFWDVSYLDNY